MNNPSLTTFHTPVMLKESIKGLVINPNGIYVDATFGGGGHSKEILKFLKKGKLYSFDQDIDAREEAKAIKNKQFEFVFSNFKYLKKYLRLYGIKQVDGILADLGISSHQIDIPKRGFSTRFDATLDMRMDQSSSLTAKKILNEYSEKDLISLLSKYGEVRNAKSLAYAITSNRKKKKINTVEELKLILELYAKKNKFQYYAQVFQSLRIVVNNEMPVLEDLLEQGAEVLKPKGRFVVISYHSLEDRRVKNFFSKGKFIGEVEKDLYGNLIRPLSPLVRKPIIASEQEIKLNKRASSAKLRIAEKN